MSRKRNAGLNKMRPTPEYTLEAGSGERIWPAGEPPWKRKALLRAVPLRLLRAQTGPAFLKTWGSTDRRKLDRRRARLAEGRTA